MTKQSRRILFIWAVAFFLVLSTLVLSFAFGFSYDFNHYRLVKTGSIVLKPNLEAQIFINDELEGRTSFLSNSFSKKRLLPGRYEVKVRKNNYFPWQKKIEIKEGLVSDFSRIILFNQKQTERLLINRQDFLAVNQEFKKAVYLEKDVINFYDLVGDQLIYQNKSLLFDRATLDIIWGLDGNEVLIFDKSQTVYFDLNKKTFQPIGSPKRYYLETAILNQGQIYFLNPLQKQSVGKGKELISFSVENLKNTIIAKNIASFITMENEIWAISSLPSQLLKMDWKGENLQILSKLTFLINPIIKQIEHKNGSYVVLIDSNLYFLKNEELVLIDNHTQGFAISPDNSVLGWYSGNEFWIEWLKDMDHQPFKKVGEREMVASLSKNIQGFNWYKNGNYVFLELENGLEVVEIDSRGVPNSHTILNLGAQEDVWYDLGQNKIYKLSNLNELTLIDLP